MGDIRLCAVGTTPPPTPSRTGVGGTAAARQTASADHNQAPRLAKACADFEALFVEQLFKTMRDSVPGGGLLDGGRAEEIYTAMLDQQVAHEMAHGQGNLGLAHQMHGRLAFAPGQDDADGRRPG